MAAGHETEDSDGARQAGLSAPDTAAHHESLAGPEGSDTETASHHDEKRKGEVDEEEDDDEEDGSTHSLDDEAEQHHDPEPEGPEGLNTGILVDPETAAAAGGPSRAQSRASSARSRPLVIVPRSQRRGLFASLVIIPEVERPYDYSRKTKWTITAIVALAAAGGPIGSNLMYPALTDIAKDLHTTETVVNLTVAFYMLAMSIFPLWWSSFSETLGRRTIYIISFGLFVVFSVLSAVSTNIGMLIAMRILGGGASASVQAVGAGTIADLWEVFERGKAMNTFYLGPLLGPLFAPIVGGALAQGLGWRSTMWFLAIFGGLNFLSLLFFLPETLARPKPIAPPPPTAPAAGDNDDNNLNHTNSLARMSTRQSVAVQTKRGLVILRRFLIDPLDCIKFLRLPPVAIVVAFAAITFSSLFILNIALQSTFSSAPYNYSTIIVGLLYIPSSLGYFITSIFGGRWVDYIMKREAIKAGRYDEKGKLIFLPEDRLCENAWIAASMFPLALIWFGWCAYFGEFWFACMVPNFFFGVGSMLVFGAVTTMLTEFLPKRSSSGVALNNFVRNIFSCIGVVVTQPLIDAMGVGWLCTMVALFALISGNACLFLLWKNAERWRKGIDEKMGVNRAAK